MNKVFYIMAITWWVALLFVFGALKISQLTMTEKLERRITKAEAHIDHFTVLFKKGE